METINVNKIDQKNFALKLANEFTYADAVTKGAKEQLRFEIEKALNSEDESPYLPIREIIGRYGVENIYFLLELKPLNNFLGIKYTTSSDPDILSICRIDESRYKVSEGYKITVKPLHPGIQTRHFYQTDLESMIKDGQITLLLDFGKSVLSL